MYSIKPAKAETQEIEKYWQYFLKDLQTLQKMENAIRLLSF